MTAWIPLVAGVGSAVTGGFLLAFSAVVMPALRSRPPAEASATMVAINEKAERIPFAGVFLVTAVAAVVTIVTTVADPEPDSALRIVGASLYLAAVVSTIVVNVPLNRRLAAAGARRETFWPRFERVWMPWNHVRTALSVAGAIALLVALP